MPSTLIRYTNSKYSEDILKGNLYLSSLSTFWDLKKGRIPYEAIESGKVTEEELKEAEKNYFLNQQDFSEGVNVQVPYNVLEKVIPSDFYHHIIYDARFRLEAYGYCNLLCFFRVDSCTITGDIPKNILLDADSIALLAKEKGMKDINSYQDIIKLPMWQIVNVAKSIVTPNLLLNPDKIYIIQLPSESMDNFGDIVIVVKDEEEFIQRVLKAVKRQGGECVTGDVRYHGIQNRVNPNTVKQHSLSIMSRGMHIKKDILMGSDGVINYGCLDKFNKFSYQKEWRVCWLPNEHNHEGKMLYLGDISDIIDIVDTKNIRHYLMNRYSGHFPGMITEERKNCKGTMSYESFKEKVENIDGKCEIMFEIG